MKKTYRANYGDIPAGDITKISESDIPDHDILVGGFPCVTFSQAGLKKGFGDTRGTLFFEIARIIKEKRPKVFLLENVKNLVNHDKGKTFQDKMGAEPRFFERREETPGRQDACLFFSKSGTISCIKRNFCFFHIIYVLEHSVKEKVDGYIGSLKGNRSVLTVLELLDIKEFNRSRKENGKYSMFARGRLQKKLMSELEWRGYPFLEVEPAFTSQTCPVCGNLNKENRVGKVFHCTCCGHEDDADHVGSINIRARAEDRELISICDAEKYNKDRRHKAIRALQTKRCQEWQEKNRQGTEQEKTLSREGVQDVSLAFGEWTACMTPPAI